MDAPYHFSKTGWTIEKIPLDHLIGEAAVIDVRSVVDGNPDTLITSQEIQNWEKAHHPLGPDNIVLFYTGWDRFWSDRKKYLGTDKPGDIQNLHFPGLSRGAAEYLVHKKIKGMGIDTPSLDAGNSHDFWAHRILLGANIYGIENLANLAELPATGAELIVAPMKIEGGTGAPVRVLGRIP